MALIALKRYEAKTIIFSISGTFSLVGAEYRFVVKSKKTDTVYILEKLNVDFDITDLTNRKVSIDLSSSDLDIDPGMYVSELEIKFSSSSIDKSADIDFIVTASVFND